jgi:hypothetical protein
MAALITAGATFALILAIGVFYVAVVGLVAFAPVLIVLAIALYALHRWLGLGPGL